MNPKNRALLHSLTISVLISLPQMSINSFWILFEVYFALGFALSICFLRKGNALPGTLEGLHIYHVPRRDLVMVDFTIHIIWYFQLWHGGCACSFQQSHCGRMTLTTWCPFTRLSWYIGSFQQLSWISVMCTFDFAWLDNTLAILLGSVAADDTRTFFTHPENR